jgi:hypothetical protein
MFGLGFITNERKTEVIARINRAYSKGSHGIVEESVERTF